MFLAPSLLLAGESPITGSVAFTSDYIFRGISQTQEKPAVQAGLNYAHDSGVHFGIWGSNINFKSKDKSDAPNDNASIELDISAGYGASLNDSINWDLSIIHYGYPGSNLSSPDKLGFWEIVPTLSYDLKVAKITGQLAYSPNFLGAAKRATYLMLGLDMPLPGDFSLNARIGEQWLKEDKDSRLSQTFVDANTPYIPKNYSEWKIGIAKQIAGLGLELAYFDTTLSKDKCQATAIFGQKDLCSPRAVFAISKNF